MRTALCGWRSHSCWNTRAMSCGSSCPTRRPLRAACRVRTSTVRHATAIFPGTSRSSWDPSRRTLPGEGSVKQFPGEYRQVIEGRGGDRKSGSRVTGSVDYRLSAISAESRQRGDPRRCRHQLCAHGAVGPAGTVGTCARSGAPHRRNIRAEHRRATERSVGRAVAQVPASGLSLILQVMADRLRAIFSRSRGR